MAVGTLAIMDSGIANELNIGWLCAQQYRYLVISGERTHPLDLAPYVVITTASDQIALLQRVSRLTAWQFIEHFEGGSTKIVVTMEKPYSETKRDILLPYGGRIQS